MTKQNKQSITDIGGYGYTVNLDGRREGATQLDGKTWAYTYDAFSQVTSGVLRNGNETVSSHSYSYDLIGNRTSSTDNGAVKAYTANTLNQYTEVDSVEFEYDADGNMLSDGQFVYEYDAMNQLISVANETEKEIFVYDFMGRRIATESYFKSGEEWIQTTRRRYVYQGWNVIAEYVNCARNKTYVWGEDLSGTLQGAGGVGGLLLVQNACGEYLPVYDGNGNIIAYKNEEGRIVSTYIYDPFGNVISHVGMDFTYKFSTKPQDELSGLYYYGYRFYQPTVGRWINRDPIRERGGRNLYRMSSNMVTNRTDYLGLVVHYCCSNKTLESEECCHKNKVVKVFGDISRNGKDCCIKLVKICITSRGLHQNICIGKNCYSFGLRDDLSYWASLVSRFFNSGETYNDVFGKEVKCFKVKKSIAKSLKVGMDLQVGERRPYHITNFGTYGSNCRAYSQTFYNEFSLNKYTGDFPECPESDSRDAPTNGNSSSSRSSSFSN